MRNFLKIDNCDPTAVLNALARQPDLWNQHDLRTTYPNSPHADADDIWLFFNEVGEDHEAVRDDRLTTPYPAWAALPQVRPIIFGLMMRVNGVQLGRALITRLAPGKRIAPHADSGAPATWFERYQIALQCAPGCVFRAADEQVMFRPGEIWWFDNTKEHEVINNSAEDRIALIVDIRCA